ncbi:MAG: HNH endonuclease signature motif containing protein, partial [Acidimicrobiales bacterium]
RGGPTDIDNLAMLCSAHHHLVHEGGWSLRGSAQGELRFSSPYVKVLSSRPAPLRAEVRGRLPFASLLDPSPGSG